MSEADHQDELEELEDVPLPSPSFDWLTVSLRAQAEMHLGLVHFGPPEQKPKPKLHLARHTIDLLAVLQEKTKGNLSLEEQRLLDNSITELRFRYVQAFEDSRKSEAPQSESQQA